VIADLFRGTFCMEVDHEPIYLSQMTREMNHAVSIMGLALRQFQSGIITRSSREMR
jgi:hypothetical protein